MNLMSAGFALSLLAASNTGFDVDKYDSIDVLQTAGIVGNFAAESNGSYIPSCVDYDAAQCAGMIGNFLLESNVEDDGFVILDAESAWGSVDEKY